MNFFFKHLQRRATQLVQRKHHEYRLHSKEVWKTNTLEKFHIHIDNKNNNNITKTLPQVLYFWCDDIEWRQSVTLELITLFWNDTRPSSI